MDHRLLISSLILISLGCSRSGQHYLEQGNKFFDQGKYEEAALNYEKAIQRDAKLGEAYHRLGLAHFKHQKLAEGYRALVRANDLMQDNAEVKALLGEVALAVYMMDQRRPQQLYDQVTKLSDELLAKDSSSVAGLRFKGALALLDRRSKDAVEYFRQAVEAQPDHREATVGLAQAFFQDQQFQEGERLLFTAIEKHKEFGPLYDTLYLQYVRAKRPIDAENILKRKVENNPKNAGALIQLAGHYARAQKPQETEATLKRLLDNPQDFPQARLHVGDFHLLAGRREEAGRHFQEGLKSAGENKSVYQKRLVGLLIAERKRNEAMAAVEEILRDAPKDTEAMAIRAGLLVEDPKPESADKALAEFQALVAQKKDDHVLQFNLGRAHLRKGDIEAARKTFLESVRLRRDYLPPRFALAELSLNQRRSEEALRQIEEILTMDANIPRARLLRATALSTLGKLPDARAELSALLKQYPNYRDAGLQLGLVAVAERKFKEAEEIFRKYQQAEGNDPRPVVGLAETFVSQKQFDQALAMLNGELKKSPDSPIVRNLIAVTAIRAGKFDMAIDQYQEMLAKTPQSADLHMRLGELYRIKGDIGRSTELFEKAQQLAPKNPAPAALMAAMFHNTGRLAEAVKSYRRALELQPDNPIVANNLAFLMAETGDNLDEALKLAQQALQKVKDQPNFSDTLGWIYLKKNMHGPALQIFNTLILKQPENPTFRYHRGMAHLAMGDKRSARIDLETALAKGPSAEEAEKIKAALAQLGV